MTSQTISAPALTTTLQIETEATRFEALRRKLAERHEKCDTDGTRRRARQTAEDNRLI